MSSAIRKLGVAILILCGSHANASARMLLNFSDFWGVTSGATLNIVQQGVNVVATGFLYTPDRTPTWISFGGVLDENNTFSGDVIQNNGDPPRDDWASNWQPFVVGHATVHFTSQSEGTLTLTLNGSTSTGTMRRANLGELDLDGNYYAAFFEDYGSCPSHTGPRFSTADVMASLQFDAKTKVLTATITPISDTGTCTYSVTLVQTGSTARGNGTFSCSGGSSGSVAVSNLRTFDNAFFASVTQSSGGACLTSGFISGFKSP